MNNLNNIILNNDTEVIATIYKNLNANSFKKEIAVKWSSLLNMLSEPIVSSDKYKRGLAVYGQLKDGNKNGKTYRAYRNNKNVINRSVLALDYDDLKPQDNFIETVHNSIGNIAYCVYSSYNHTKEAPRYRLLIPLQVPTKMTDTVYRATIKAIRDMIGLPYDASGEKISQLMNLPVIKTKESEYIFTYNDCKIITLDTIIDIEAVEREQQKAKSHRTYEPKHNDNFWDEIASGISEGGRNNGLTSLAGFLFQKRLPDRLIFSLLAGFNDTFCSPALSENELLNIYTSVFKTYYNMKNMEAD